MSEIPRQFHFVYGLRPQDEPFHLAHYLCLESCRRINLPERIVFHTHHEPHGPWWDRIKPHVTLTRIEPETFVTTSPRYLDHAEGRFIRHFGLDYAHQSDFLRLKILIAHGGVYADIDTLFVNPIPSAFFTHPFVIGEEDPIAFPASSRPQLSLCNALLMAEPRSTFAVKWLARMYEVFDGTWSRHSCDEAARLSSTMPDALHIVPPAAFYPFMWHQEGLANLFERRTAIPDGLLSIHLWSHLWWAAHRTDFSRFHGGLLTEDYVRRGQTTYAALARPFLD